MTICPVRSFAFIATVVLGVSASTVMLAGCDSTPSSSAGDPASAAVESDTPEGLLVSGMTQELDACARGGEQAAVARHVVLHQCEQRRRLVATLGEHDA